MKTKLLLLLLIISSSIFAQEDAWVYFTGKPNASTFLANPLTMVTQRSIDRRETQGISFNTTDAPIEITYYNAIKNASGITIMAKSKWLNAVHVRGSITDIQALTILSFVASIDFANHSLNPGSKITSSNHKQTQVKDKFEVTATFNYGNSANQIQMLNGHLLHEQNFTGQNKIIAVFDAGFPGVNTAAPYQRLYTNNLILGGYNFPDRNETIYTRNSHGTNVLSTMGGFQENSLVGTAPDAAYYLFITEDVNSENPVEESYWVEAAEMADSLGVDVINSSLGYTDYDNPNYSYSYAQRNGQVGFASRGAAMLMSKGIVGVVSAGNEGNSSEPHMGIPSDADNILTVGSVTSTEIRSSFSSIGPSFDGRIKPDVCAKGSSATVSNTSGNITTSSGTSFSSPILAGMVATFWSAMPNLTAAQVIQLVKESADQYTNPDNLKGYGVPDFQLALNLANNILISNDVILYPNPVKEQLFIKLPKETYGNLAIYNNVGQQVMLVNVAQKEQAINLSALSSGIYIYDFSTNSTNLRGKIIKE